jgi:predicted NACHT family NTPase
VEDEKQIVRDVCDQITGLLSLPRSIQVKVIEWKKDVIPLITGEGAQSVIDKQIAEYEYDIYVGILWSRFGDKKSDGLTPTEGEFEDAFKRKKETGSPVIKVYFKSEKSFPLNSYEEEQICEVIKFKKKIRDRDIGLYDEFEDKEDFRKKILQSLLYVIEHFVPLTSGKSGIAKQKYSEPPGYLQRNVILGEKYTPGTLFLRNELSQDILSVVKQRNRIVLLSDAGVGKTIELQRIAWHYSNDDSPFYPLLLPLNKYVNQNISELLPPNWSSIPDSQLLIILDGLDEIESKNKNDAIRQIEFFSEQHPNSHIIVSCRTNFYKSESKQSSSTLSGFSSYVLLDLDSAEIEKYVEVRLGKHAKAFNETVIKNQLQDLLRIPFYLTRLVDIFENNGTLPESKAEIFEQLLIARMQLDVEHFRTTIELHDKQKAIIGTLERVALAMETLGRNYITDDEFAQFEADESLRTLLKYCTAWKKQKGETVTWQFEHNNFQEYLAARILSRQSLEVIQDFISFKPDYQKIIPSWINTLSFLVSISNNSDLIRWIIKSEPEIAVKFEPDKIEVTDRIRIFKEVFNNYKEKQIWIDRDKFSYMELARFGRSDEVFDFLLTQAENAAHYTTLSNAIELLSELKIPYSRRDRTCQLLMKCALDKDKGGGIQNRALMALADLRLNSREVVDQILDVLRSSDNDWVRYGLYYFLLNSDYLDENIEEFLEGIKYVRLQPSRTGRETRIGDEHWHLKIGLERAKSPDAIKKIFNYFKENYRDLDDAFLEKSISIFAEKAAVAYSEDNKLFESVLELLAILITEHMEEQGKQLIRFFDITRTRFEAFQKVFSQKSGNNYYLIILATLADEKSIELFAQEYEKQNVTESDVWTFQNYLSWENPDLYLPFNKLINEKSSNKFVLPPRRDFDKEKKQRRQSDIDLLFDKKGFLDQIKLIFDTEQKDTFTSRELSGIETHRWDNPYFSDLAIHTLRELARDQTRSFEIVSQIVNSWDWDLFCISKLYEYLTTYKEIVILEEQRVWIASWCHTSINKVNFKTALVTGPNDQSSTSWIAIYIWYFVRLLNLTYPIDVLLDMLSFDWVEGHKMHGIAYLEA